MGHDIVLGDRLQIGGLGNEENNRHPSLALSVPKLATVKACRDGCPFYRLCHLDVLYIHALYASLPKWSADAIGRGRCDLE